MVVSSATTRTPAPDGGRATVPAMVPGRGEASASSARLVSEELTVQAPVPGAAPPSATGSETRSPEGKGSYPWASARRVMLRATGFPSPARSTGTCSV